jgi:hypothetical protein
MNMQDFLREIRLARLAGCPVTVDTIIAALDREVDNTARSNINTTVALLRGWVPNPVKS